MTGGNARCQCRGSPQCTRRLGHLGERVLSSPRVPSPVHSCTLAAGVVVLIECFVVLLLLSPEGKN